MKKLSVILAFAIIMSIASSVNVLALNVGDKLGDVLNTNVKTYINNERIPCYNINNKAVVIVADLKNYGFDSTYDDSERTTTITRNYRKKFMPIKNISNNTAKAGTVAFSYLYTDITAIVNGKKVESFNIKGNLAIYFESLGDYGQFSWDGTTNSSKLSLNQQSASGSLKYYENFPSVPDFGKLYNVKDEFEDLHIFNDSDSFSYKGNDLSKYIEDYYKILEDNGFTLYKTNQGELFYEKDRVTVMVKIKTERKSFQDWNRTSYIDVEVGITVYVIKI